MVDEDLLFVVAGGAGVGADGGARSAVEKRDAIGIIASCEYPRPVVFTTCGLCFVVVSTVKLGKIELAE